MDCSTQEDNVVYNAWAILTEIRADPTAFRNCMQTANLVEINCVGQQAARDRAVNALASYNAYKVTCADIPPPDPKNPNIITLADAYVRINGTELRVDRDLLTRPVREVAATIAHEIMHNRGGFRHDVNKFSLDPNNPYYRTVPEQAKACVQNGAPNAGAGDAACGTSFPDCNEPTDPIGRRWAAKNSPTVPTCFVATPTSDQEDEGADLTPADYQSDSEEHLDESID